VDSAEAPLNTLPAGSTRRKSNDRAPSSRWQWPPTKLQLGPEADLKNAAEYDATCASRPLTSRSALASIGRHSWFPWQRSVPRE